MNNRQLFLQHLAQTSDTPLMLEIERAEGIYMYDKQVKKYIDLISGIGNRSNWKLRESLQFLEIAGK